MQDPKQLRNKQPLAYLRANTNLIECLPYIDEEYPGLKNNVEYLIRTQQKSLPFNEETYLEELSLPNTPFIDSRDFNEKIANLKHRLESGQQMSKQKQSKKQGEIQFQVPKVKSAEFDKELNQLKIRHQSNMIKEINLQLYQKFSPSLMKQSISAFENQKQLLQNKIQLKRAQIEAINTRRKYSQLEARERQQTIYQRTQVMLYKRRKVQ